MRITIFGLLLLFGLALPAAAQGIRYTAPAVDSTARTAASDAQTTVDNLIAGQLYVGMSAGAENADDIDIAISMKDKSGAAQAANVDMLCTVRDNDGLQALTTAFTLAETGAGSEVSTTGKASLIIRTAGGLATLRVHDVAGASGATVHVICTPFFATGMLTPNYVTTAFN